MSTASAREVVDLVGRTVRPVPGTERHAFRGDGIGTVINVYIPDLDHPFAVCDFGTDVEYLHAFELEVINH